MAWLLVGGAGAVVAYLTYEASNLYDTATKPMYDYFEKQERDKLEKHQEEIRQQNIERTKKMHNKNNKIREQYGLKIPKNHIKLVNDTQYTCSLVYVNHYQATSNNEAITYAKQVIDNSSKYFNNIFSTTKTKTIIIPPNSNVELIQREFNEYYLVILVDDKFDVLNYNKNMNNQISIKKSINKDDSVDLACRFFG